MGRDISDDEMINDFKKGICPLEKALIVASGFYSEERINKYTNRIDVLQDGFEDWFDDRMIDAKHADDKQKGEGLYHFLQEGFNKVYCDDFLLTKVIDNQMMQKKRIGNCVGRTSLYNILAERINLKVGVEFSTTHIISTLDANEEYFLIENAHLNEFPVYGFAFSDEIDPESESIILSSVYVSKGLQAISKNPDLALQEMNRAIRVYDDSLAYESRGMLKGTHFNKKHSALKDLQKAVTIDPLNRTALTELGIVNFELRKYDEALKYLYEATFPYPTSEQYHYIRLANKELKDTVDSRKNAFKEYILKAKEQITKIL